MKTSLSLDDQLIQKIDDYRAHARPIPSLSKAITDLIQRGLEEHTEIPKEENRLEDLTLHIRDPEGGRGGTSQLNLPYAKMKELGLSDKDQISITIRKSLKE